MTDGGDARNNGVGGDDPAAADKRRRVRRVMSAVLAIAASGGLIWATYYHLHARFMQTTNNAYLQADAVTVSPKVAGYVETVFVADDQLVAAGQPLVRIDRRDLLASAREISAQIDVAKASRAAVEAQLGEQEAAIERARADLGTARSESAFAAAEAARYGPLAATGAEPAERLAQLRAQATQARSRVLSAQATLTGAQGRAQAFRAQMRQAEAQASVAKAQLDSVRNDLDSTLVRASVDGRIGSRSVRPGQYAQAGTKLMSVVPTEQLYVTANFKETQVGMMRVGQSAHVAVDALPGVKLSGRVIGIAPGTGAQFSILPPQNATGNFTKIVQRVPVRVALDIGPEARRLLLPGMSVEVTIDTRSAKGLARRVRDEQQRLSRRRGS